MPPMNNMTDFADILAETEKRWLKSLFNEIKKEFTSHPLPSHDHTHHLRVWYFARDLLTALSAAGCRIDQNLVEKTLISVLFHDTGMTATIEPSHGIESRLICEKYFSEKGGIDRSSLDEILEAVEMHDDKQYAEKMQGINTYTILTVADDLDAYGAIGVYRYYEIYLLRGIEKKEIPGKAIDNINTRFSFMERSFGFLDTFIRKHEARKKRTINYFEQFSSAPFAPPDLKPCAPPDLKSGGTYGAKRKPPLTDKSFECLNRLVKEAPQHRNGLDFFLENGADPDAGNIKLNALINEIKKELRLMQNKYLFIMKSLLDS
jgi:HD superfamily phosphodiesterase